MDVRSCFCCGMQDIVWGASLLSAVCLVDTCRWESFVHGRWAGTKCKPPEKQMKEGRSEEKEEVRCAKRSKEFGPRIGGPTSLVVEPGCRTHAGVVSSASPTVPIVAVAGAEYLA